MVVHPAPGHAQGTLVNALMHHCPDLGDIGGTVRPGIVHRLDKGTTGLIVVCKHAQSMESMSRAFFDREIKKTYRALVQGSPQVTGVFDTLFGRHPSDRLKFTSKCSKGKSATTRYRRLTNSRGFPMLRSISVPVALTRFGFTSLSMVFLFLEIHFIAAIGSLSGLRNRFEN